MLLRLPESLTRFRMRKRKSKYTLPLTVSLAVICALILVIGLTTKHRNRANSFVFIPHGSSISRIARILDSSDVISNRYLFMAMAKLTANGSRLQSGVYKFPEKNTILEVVTILAEGSHQVAAQITIPEGATIKSIAGLLFSKCNIRPDSFIGRTRDKAFIRSLGIPAASLEGYLMPDTYIIRFDDPIDKIIRLMVQQYKSYFSSNLVNRARERKMTIHEVLTMASIVEGETGIGSERARIAGVYYNRLKRNMLLQADPTIQYIIPDSPRRLFFKDLEIESSYNTYRHKGLPPGPINNPGRAAIHAALYPETHSFYYFVADGKGGHRFSHTAAEHDLAVQAYRKIQQAKRNGT
jgi:UPF0755 protein